MILHDKQNIQNKKYLKNALTRSAANIQTKSIMTLMQNTIIMHSHYNFISKRLVNTMTG